jgi:hypothetical protein
VVCLSFKDEYYKNGYKLSFTQKAILSLKGYVKIFSIDLYGRGLIDFYAIKCKDHGYVVTYPTSYAQTLNCPFCPFSDGKPKGQLEPEKIKLS